MIAILKPDKDSDNACVVELYGDRDTEEPVSIHRLRRTEIGIVMSEGDDHPYSSHIVNGALEPATRSKALKVPTTGSLIFHVAAAMTRRGYVCLLRGDAG